MTTATIEPRVFPTYRQFDSFEIFKFEKLGYLIKKYGCVVPKISDGKDWIRVYFDIPIDSKEAFFKELAT